MECDSYNDDSTAVCFVCGSKRAATVVREAKEPVVKKPVTREPVVRRPVSKVAGVRRSASKITSDAGKAMHKELVDRDRYEKIHERLAACYEISVVISIALVAIALMGSLLFGNIEEVGHAMAMTSDRVEDNIDELMHSDYHQVIERIRTKLMM